MRITFKDRKGEAVLLTGLLEDLNRTGLCLSVSLPVSIGAAIEFECDGFAGTATVEYCNIGNYSYLVGVSFAEGLVWDEATWRPQHLLSFAEPSP